ncbi:MAG: DUF4178 domain-containing protein [Bryobacteraceae bacterium]|jgi:hypothetical protein
MSAPHPPHVKALNCPSCGAPLTIHGMQHTLTVVCANCLSVLDAKDPNLQVLQKFEAQQRIQPLIPLGTRGKVRGDTYEVIGFQVRGIEVDSIIYTWAEYLLFNPYKGFRYLTEYQGHWNDVTVLRTLPEVSALGARPVAKYLGETYKHFQTAEAETRYVLGEFPWQVRVGEKVTAMDFVSPPRMLSSETTAAETTWSLGEYIPGARVWEAFKLPGKAPSPVGIFENQPSPYKGSPKHVWVIFLILLAALFVVAQVTNALSAKQVVLQGHYSFTPGSTGPPSVVTPTFELKGRPCDVEFAIRTDLTNNWAYFHFTLMNTDAGEASEFGREVSYYSGSDSDGSWTEGGPTDDVLIPTVPAGHYYLLIEPEMDATAAPMNYSIELRRDVPAMSYFWIAALLLLIPPIFTTFRSITFESRRWGESDYAPSSD